MMYKYEEVFYKVIGIIGAKGIVIDKKGEYPVYTIYHDGQVFLYGQYDENDYITIKVTKTEKSYMRTPYCPIPTTFPTDR